MKTPFLHKLPTYRRASDGSRCVMSRANGTLNDYTLTRFEYRSKTGRQLFTGKKPEIMQWLAENDYK